MKGDAALSVPLVFIHLRACLLGGIWGILLGTSSRFVKLQVNNLQFSARIRIKLPKHVDEEKFFHHQIAAHKSTTTPTACESTWHRPPQSWMFRQTICILQWHGWQVCGCSGATGFVHELPQQLQPKFKPLIRLSNGSILLFVRGFARFLFGALQQWRFWNLDQKNDIYRLKPPPGWLYTWLHDVYSAGINRERVRTTICLYRYYWSTWILHLKSYEK